MSGRRGFLAAPWLLDCVCSFENEVREIENDLFYARMAADRCRLLQIAADDGTWLKACKGSTKRGKYRFAGLQSSSSSRFDF